MEPLLNNQTLSSLKKKKTHAEDAWVYAIHRVHV